MDLVTNVLITAIDHGAAAASSPPALADAYRHLKTLIVALLAGGAGDTGAELLAELEHDPGAISRQLTLTERLNVLDPAIAEQLRSAAHELQNRVGSLSRSSTASHGGVATRPPPALAASEAGYVVQQVFFGTDRNLTDSEHVARRFGEQRDRLRYGSCEVSIPRDHRMGELERRSLWRLEFRDNPGQHVLLLDATLQDEAGFFAAMSSRIGQTPDRRAFVFVHGYNVSFEDAARRSAQIAYDLGFDGAAVFYSWPSQGRISGYLVDEGNIEWAQSGLKGFLLDVLQKSGANSVYLIAHSMGNRALTRAVADIIAEQPALAAKLREIILTAPDIDAAVFRNDIAPALTAGAHNVTLYASSADRALAASQRLHGYPRAGDSGDGLVVVPGIETIDASEVDTGFVGHSYFAADRSALSDMFYLITSGVRADQRFGLEPVDTAAGRHWMFRA